MTSRLPAAVGTEAGDQHPGGRIHAVGAAGAVSHGQLAGEGTLRNVRAEYSALRDARTGSQLIADGSAHDHAAFATGVPEAGDLQRRPLRIEAPLAREVSHRAPSARRDRCTRAGSRTNSFAAGATTDRAAFRRDQLASTRHASASSPAVHKRRPMRR